MYKTRFHLLSLSLFLICSSSLFAQTPQQILDRMIEQYSNSISDVETMMMITKMEGFMESEPDTTYYRKVMTDDYPTLQVVQSGSQTPASNYYSVQENYEALIENATYEGTDTVNDREVHVLFIEDVSALYDDMVTGAGQQEEYQPQSGRMYIDTEDYIPLRMNFDINYDEGHTGSADIMMSDIRNIDGMLVPFLMEMNIEGISGQMSPEDMAEARKGLKELEEQMKNASGVQKRIMENAFKPQMEQLRKILDEGSMTMRTIVLDVQTNVSVPD